MGESRQVGNSVLRLEKQDITDFEVEAFVYYARPDLALGAGFGGAIAKRGGPSIKSELDAIGRLEVTEAAVTGAGKMKARYIVHAVGPAFQEENLESKLEATIVNALKRAEEKGIRSLAFPLMGAGFYGVPLPLCTEIMIRALCGHLARGSSLEEVIVCANDAREYRAFQAGLESLPDGRPGGK